ncbi:multicopper oxidase family protein [Pengzhenrongella frigida]|uniref:Multicopper oxidase family protein n=1 Tax=Pengzhenrongella frigida TaxID=1259133 RepID=A0A4Q5MVV3_9MICO|nr:multicopper oxidase family protein [Cellulomonas sp. HLT2-17]RYV49670.1 multicopper oxidase family protein [Cellulomonas sp. HLT2-17]
MSRTGRRRLHLGRQRLRLAVACGATALIVGLLGVFWYNSRLPASYSVMDMGHAEYGGGPIGSMPHDGHDGHAGGEEPAADGAASAVPALTADQGGAPDVEMTLVARAERFQPPSGDWVDGYTLNGQSPGPVLRVTAGELVQVRLENESVAEGVTLHWHGLELPNADDGVAGVTQDAVAIGAEHTYRFVADQPGTFWYHSHQLSHEQVRRGVLGALVVLPQQATSPDADPPDADPADADVVALVHRYGGKSTVNGHRDDLRIPAAPNQRVRVRVINTENGPMSAWVGGASFRLVAVDGRDLHEPTLLEGTAVLVTAGGRADLEVTMPTDGSGVRVQLGGSAVVLGPASAEAAEVPRPAETVDLLSYGTPADLGIDWGTPDRRFDYDIGRRPGFLDGRPGMWWTINGRLYPEVPAYMVAEGDIVVVHIANHSGEVHPMHLHGHHAVVLRRDGEPATGSPWWVDSLNVSDGESYDLGFVATNPGIWMYHCHNLPHASEGLVAHLMYEGVTTPFVLGGPAGNEPE